MTRSDYRGATIEDAGAHNTRIVLRAIRAQGMLTKAELARQTGLAHPTVTNIARRLIERGLLRTAGMQRGGRGQPATRLVINGEGAHAIGINVDRDHVFMVLADFAGRVQARLDQDIASALPEQVHSFYSRNLDQLLGVAGVEAGAITGVGLALPDQPDGGAQWSAASLEALFADPLGRPVFVETDAAAAAIGEMQFGRG
jgi:DNA-binding Lrp family transcriptional regulator